MSPGKFIYVTYADGAFERNLGINAWFARVFMRCDSVVALRRGDLEADPIYLPNQAVFDARRGAGYWAWKPWAILRALEGADDGDVIIYQDCGFGLRYRSVLQPRNLRALAKKHGCIAGVRVHHHGANRRWTHRACLEAMGITDPVMLDGPQVEAVVSLWTVSAVSKAFVREWLRYCLDPVIVGDAATESLSDQDSVFVEHRYDQSILTNLVNKTGAYTLSPAWAIQPYAKSVTALEIDQRAASGSWSGLLAIKLMIGVQRLRGRPPLSDV